MCLRHNFPAPWQVSCLWGEFYYDFKPYVSLHQRSSGYISMPTKRARGPVARGFLEFARMTVKELVACLLDDGLLIDLKGTPCPHPDCLKSGLSGSEERVLGSCRVNAKSVRDEVTSKTAFHRCLCCRRKYSVCFMSPLYKLVGSGCSTANTVTLCFWNCVYGASVTLTAAQCKLNEKTVQKYYDLAKSILSDDAALRQSSIKFGGGSDNTVDIEADESVFGKWKVWDAEQNEWVYYWYVWLGIVQQGDFSKYWLKCIGVTSSRGEGRLPPMKHEFWCGAPLDC